MSKVKYDVMAITGTYKDREGQEKKRWMKCGVVIQGDKGFSLKLEAVPLNSEGWFSLFEPKQKEQQGKKSGGIPPEYDDDIPY